MDNLLYMKNLLLLLFVSFTLSLFTSSCATSNADGTSTENKKARKALGEGQLNNNLADLLRKNTPLVINGQHPNVAISIRGINTIRGDSRPFFIIDNSRIGRSYAQANNAVNLQNVKSIRVLKGLSELAVYGQDGVNGVIIIEHLTNN